MDYLKAILSIEKQGNKKGITFPEFHAEPVHALLATNYSNIAACELHLDLFSKCVQHATEVRYCVVQLDP